jgi:hypothetical protein
MSLATSSIERASLSKQCVINAVCLDSARQSKPTVRSPDAQCILLLAGHRFCKLYVSKGSYTKLTLALIHDIVIFIFIEAF